MCQEHYDKVVRYAKEIGDESLQACLAKLKSWEEHSAAPAKSNCTEILHPIRFFSNTATPTAALVSSAGWSTTARQTARGATP